MQAEQRASVIVSEARTARTQRMKEAKDEAATVIKLYQSQKEAEFAAANLDISSSNGNDAELARETQKDMEKMKGQFEKNQSKALQLLLAKTCEVSLDVPAARIRSAQKKNEMDLAMLA